MSHSGLRCLRLLRGVERHHIVGFGIVLDDVDVGITRVGVEHQCEVQTLQWT